MERNLDIYNPHSSQILQRRMMRAGGLDSQMYMPGVRFHRDENLQGLCIWLPRVRNHPESMVARTHDLAIAGDQNDANMSGARWLSPSRPRSRCRPRLLSFVLRLNLPSASCYSTTYFAARRLVKWYDVRWAMPRSMRVIMHVVFVFSLLVFGFLIWFLCSDAMRLVIVPAVCFWLFVSFLAS